MANLRETGVFCVNIVSFALREAMNRSSGPWPRETDEFALAGLERAECETIPCSRVVAAPASLECRVSRVIELEGEANLAAFGTVTGVHLRDDCLSDGIFDITRFEALARCGYRDYAVVREVFAMDRPG